MMVGPTKEQAEMIERVERVEDSVRYEPARAQSAMAERPMFDDHGVPITYRVEHEKDYCDKCKSRHTTINCPPVDALGNKVVSKLAGHMLAHPDDNHTLLAVSEAERAAHIEFREAAREARATQEAAQKAAKRYADAVRRLSEVCAPPTTTTE